MYDQVIVKSSHYLAAGFALVAAMSWNSAIRESIDKTYPMPEDNIFAKFMYAIFITVLLIFIVSILPDTRSQLPSKVRTRINEINYKEVEERIKTLENMISHTHP